MLVVTGVAGDEEHAATFQKWATSFIDAAKNNEHVPDTNITWLSDRKATREGVTKAFADLAARAKPSDIVFVLLIGHGSFDGTSAAFNLPGPDLTAVDYAKLLGTLASTHVVFVNTASS
ncbi:MAG: caspase family protein, partial [Acidobacteria bacterium]|nr:caspase family protein [Acidobacteriota bacterium]